MSLNAMAVGLLSVANGSVAAQDITAPFTIAPSQPVVIESTSASVQQKDTPDEPIVQIALPASPYDNVQSVDENPSEQNDAQPSEQVPVSDDTTVIVVTGQGRAPGDPIENINAQSFTATQAIDDAITAPVADAYKTAVPRPVRSGLRNFLANLHEPVVFVNFLLQHKIGKAAETFGRFAINSTVGALGVIDVAKRKPFNLPRRPNGFANTMGFYGVKPGAFLYLPLIGPTTVRDMTGNILDRMVLPVGIGTPFNSIAWTGPTGAVHTIDRRVENDEKLKTFRESDDPYISARDFYLERRQAEIDALHGKGDISRLEADPEPQQVINRTCNLHHVSNGMRGTDMVSSESHERAIERPCIADAD